MRMARSVPRMSHWSNPTWARRCRLKSGAFQIAHGGRHEPPWDKWGRYLMGVSPKSVRVSVMRVTPGSECEAIGARAFTPEMAFICQDLHTDPNPPACFSSEKRRDRRATQRHQERDKPINDKKYYTFPGYLDINFI